MYLNKIKRKNLPFINLIWNKLDLRAPLRIASHFVILNIYKYMFNAC